MFAAELVVLVVVVVHCARLNDGIISIMKTDIVPTCARGAHDVKRERLRVVVSRSAQLRDAFHSLGIIIIMIIVICSSTSKRLVCELYVLPSICIN